MGIIAGWREARVLKRKEKEERDLLRKYPLKNVSATVFVRQPNGSRTSIEHYLEAELINRGARVMSADQRLGMEFLAQGTFALLAADIHAMLIGTLVVQNDVDIEEIEWLESLMDYEARESVHRERLSDWRCDPGWYSQPPPFSERKYIIHSYRGRRLQLSYRLVSSGGAILVSGHREYGVRDGMSEDPALLAIADGVLEHLMSEKIWDRIDL